MLQGFSNLEEAGLTNEGRWLVQAATRQALVDIYKAGLGVGVKNIITPENITTFFLEEPLKSDHRALSSRLQIPNLEYGSSQLHFDDVTGLQEHTQQFSRKEVATLATPRQCCHRNNMYFLWRALNVTTVTGYRCLTFAKLTSP